MRDPRRGAPQGARTTCSATQLAKAPTARGRWLAARRARDDATTRRRSRRSPARLRGRGRVLGACASSAPRRSARSGRARLRRARDGARGEAPEGASRRRRRARRLPDDEAAEAASVRARCRDASYLVEAEAARALGKTQAAVGVRRARRGGGANSPGPTSSRVGAIDGLAALRDERATAAPPVADAVRPPDARAPRGVLALPKLTTRQKTREALEDLLDDADPHLRHRRRARPRRDRRREGARRRCATASTSTSTPRVRRRLREALRDLGGRREARRDQMQGRSRASCRASTPAQGARRPARGAASAADAPPERGHGEGHGGASTAARQARRARRRQAEASRERPRTAPIRVERRGAVAVWTIDRPDRMNASRAATLSRSASSRAKRRPTPACAPS